MINSSKFYLHAHHRSFTQTVLTAKYIVLSMPEQKYKVDVVDVLKSIIYEKNYPLLEGKTPDSKFIASNKMSLRFAVLQLALVDIGLFFSIIQISSGSVSAINYLLLFLLIMNILVCFLLYFVVHETTRNITNNEGYWYVLHLTFCKTCNANTITNEDAIFHKIENPEHLLGKYEVRVNIDSTTRFLDIFKPYEVFLIIALSFILVFLNIELHNTMFAMFASWALLLYMPSLLVIYLYRRLKRRMEGSILKLLRIRQVASRPDIFNLEPLILDKRYLKRWPMDVNEFPTILNLDGDQIFLIERYDFNLNDNVEVKAFRGLSPGPHIL